MYLARLKENVLPFRQSTRGPSRFRSVEAAVAAVRPNVPMLCLHPVALVAAAARFANGFAGRVLYAVKCNPEPAVLRALVEGGIRHFDCASLTEVRTIRRLAPNAEIAFMHPVKPRPAIREAYGAHGVRCFVFDSAAELAKIAQETEQAGDLTLVVRLGLPKGDARLDLSGKFGAEPAEAVRLLRAARGRAVRLGLSFHVGSQCLEPAAFARAIALAGAVIAEAGVVLDVLDVGGGFPVAYHDQEPPAPAAYFAAIDQAVSALEMAVPDLAGGVELWCEPGRALVASGQTVVVQVLGRRGDYLFVNDGVYGTLADAGALNFRYPCRLIRADRPPASTDLQEFGLFGPTCDSADRMDGPFLLPADVAEGDWIAFTQIGAYGTVMRTGFNGFDEAISVEIAPSARRERVATGYHLARGQGFAPGMARLIG
ncbi:MAG: type III PLP-dependent enzyme [Azospirillum sp.]|nr:type III PLP-dependent enzyme [Azospirillum sp.]